MHNALTPATLYSLLLVIVGQTSPKQVCVFTHDGGSLLQIHSPFFLHCSSCQVNAHHRTQVLQFFSSYGVVDRPTQLICISDIYLLSYQQKNTWQSATYEVIPR